MEIQGDDKKEFGLRAAPKQPGRTLPVRLSRQLWMALKMEIGDPMLISMARQAGIDSLSAWIESDVEARGMRSEEYACLLAAVRGYYGQGARGLLTRVGGLTWEGMVHSSGAGVGSIGLIGRILLHRRAAKTVLQLLAKELGGGGGEVSVHQMDMDFYLVDGFGDATQGVTAGEPICSVTLGLIQGVLSWGTGKEFDVEEIACKAAGGEKCKFRIRA